MLIILVYSLPFPLVFHLLFQGDGEKFNLSRLFHIRLPARYSLILLDISLPDKNGMELYRDLRNWTLAPILFLSSKTGDSDKISVLSAGGDDFIGSRSVPAKWSSVSGLISF